MKMTKDEINRGIYKLIHPDECLHKWELDENKFVQVDSEIWGTGCIHCDEVVEFLNITDLENQTKELLPDYCSDRNLCVDVLDGFDGNQGLIFQDKLNEYAEKGIIEYFMVAPPRIIAEVIYRTLKETK